LSDQDVVGAIKGLDQTGNGRVDLRSKVPLKIDLQVLFLNSFRMESSLAYQLLLIILSFADNVRNNITNTH
jgi:hypothetical protein